MGGVHVIYAIIMHGLVLDDLDLNEFKYVYIGMTNDFTRRMGEHLQCVYDLEYKTSGKLYNRLRYHGWNNFDKVILMSGLSEEDAKNMEIYLIAKYNTYEKGLNSTPGGEALSGANNPRAEAINIYNNSTGEIFSFSWIGGAAEYLGIKPGCIKHVIDISHGSEQTYSPVHKTWFQIKKAYDETPFIENMPTRNEKHSGSNNHRAKAVNVYNNSTGEIILFDWIGAAAKYLGINPKIVRGVLSSSKLAYQTYSKKHKAWFQVKYMDDKTPFIKDMPTPDKKKSGENNSQAKPVYAFGSLFGAASVASDTLRYICNNINQGNFIQIWIGKNKFPDTIFQVTKEFYKRYKNTNVSITREMYDDFVNQTQ